MIVFHCDLDNTLIYSHKHTIPGPKTCVERYKGREISFMTNTSLALLNVLRKKIMFVPTTTRTMEQYERIQLGFSPEYALVCNGGVLLHNGKSDETWYRESLSLVSEAQEELHMGMKFLQVDENRSFELRFIENLFVFTKSAFPEKTLSILREKLLCRDVVAFQNGTKIYLLPRMLSKGVALDRFKEQMYPQITLAAGDSEFDISMLTAADCGFAPDLLFGSKIPPNIMCFSAPFDQGFLNELTRRYL